MRNLLVALSLAATLAAAQAQADDATAPKRAYVGSQLGIGIVTSTSGASFFTWGLRAGYGVWGNENGMLSLGLHTVSFGQTTTVGSVTEQDSFFGFGPEIISRHAFGTGLYLGARVGMAIQSATLIAGSSTYYGSATRFLIGPAAGYEIDLSEKAGITLDLNWMTAGGGTITIPGLGSAQFNSSQALLIQGGVLVHF